MKKELWLTSCGLVPYEKALGWQKTMVDQKMHIDMPDVVLFLEHPPVITIGKNGDPSHVLIGAQQCREKGLSVFPISRGGDVTFHGPGQVVGYPLVNLQNFDKSIRSFVTDLEQVFISLLQNTYCLPAKRIPGYTGVWVHDNKITAMGLSVHKYITMHGFAFNVSTDLQYFSLITPCGITDKGVTSLVAETGQDISTETCIQQIGDEMGNRYHKEIVWKSCNEVLQTFQIPIEKDET
ncbi:MAG: lipoyl(octanoyl) transferase LipB [Caldisericia bacterium]|nr:lipoyl(octanoyl) transferase LipB [Caldisericia bacterium]MDD4613917.1 lipoyl(octanoyl) transferase LipB [Caldisericia bacterium]